MPYLRGGIRGGIGQAAGNLNDFLQNYFQSQNIQKRQQELAQLNHLQSMDAYKMEHPSPEILKQITDNPETTSPELVRQSLEMAAKNNAPNVPKFQGDQSKWGLMSADTGDALGSRTIRQTTPLTQLVNQSLGTLKAQQGALATKQAREDTENPVYQESIGPDGETIKTAMPRGTLTRSVGSTNAQDAARKQMDTAAEKAGNRDTPADITAAASKAAAVTTAENPAFEARSAADALAQETATAPRRAHEESVKFSEEQKKQMLDALDKEEAGLMPQAHEMLTNAGSNPVAQQQVATWLTTRKRAIDTKRTAVITGKSATAPAPAVTPARKRTYNPATGQLD